MINLFNRFAKHRNILTQKNMKKIYTILYLCVVAFCINIFIIVFKSKAATNTPSPVAYTSDENNPAVIVSDVFMPAKFDLAGEAVPLQRLDVQESFKKELIVNTYLHSHTIQILKNSPRIFAIIEPILQKNGIPDDFKYLAVIESNLNPLAVSPAGAVGVWQFMKGTAQELGLEVNTEIDERYNIEKSTEAAAKYLQKAYEKFGSWTMAAASYNAGSSMISKQMDIQKENNYYDLLLGEETGRYVFRILALKQIINHPELYNFNVQTIYPSEKVKKIKVTGAVKSWADFAHEQGISYKILKRFNPWLRKTELRNPHHKTYEISIPAKTELYK